MKKFIIISLLIPMLGFAQKKNKNSKENKELIHLVLLKFKDNVSPAIFENEAYKFLNSINVVEDLLFSKNISHEGFDRGFMYALSMKFNSEYDRDSIYLPHPKHLEFGKKYWDDYISNFVVYDYWEDK